MNTRWLLLVTACLLAVTAAAPADDWPQWRGPDRTDISKEKGLLQQWPKDGPKLLWKSEQAGIGFSGFAVVGDVLYTMGARGEEEYALAFDIKNNGNQLWATKVGPIFLDPLKSYGDGPRCTPTVDGDRVYCLGAQGELLCLNRDKGTVVWRRSMAKDFKGDVMEHEKLRWGYCESPLVDGDKLICCPGGAEGWMIALDKMTGKDSFWRTKGLGDQATYSSIVTATIGGVRQYINSSFKGEDGAGLVGVAAADGKVLWYATLKDWNCYAICSTPIVQGDLVYATAGYVKGCCAFKIEKDGAGKFKPTDIYDKKARLLMQNEHGGVVLVDGHIFGNSDPYGWVCQDLLTGKAKWKEKRELDGKGSLTYADGHFYILSDEGTVVLLKASIATEDYWQEKGRFTLPQLSKTRQTRPSSSGILVWTHPVVANGRLFVRDQELLYCYAVR